MSNNRWDENEIEKTLTKLPPIKDQQSKDDLFRAIEKRAQSERPSRKANRKKATWLYPTMASVAAIFLILLVVPSFLNGSEEFSTNDSNNDMQTATLDSAGNDQAEVSTENETMESAEVEGDENGSDMNAQNDSEIIEERFFSPEETVLIAQVIFLEANGATLEKVGLKERKIDGEMALDDALMMSLKESDPTSGKVLNQLQGIRFELGETRTVILEFPQEHGLESLASAEHGFLDTVFDEILSAYGFDELQLLVEGEQEMIYGQRQVDGPISIPSNNRGYYLYRDGEDLFLISGREAEEDMTNQAGEPFTFAETLDEMMRVNGENGWYESVIPSSVEITNVEVVENQAYVTLSGIEAISGEDELYEMMIQSFLLVADNFSFETIQLSNQEDGIIGEYNLRNIE